VEHLQELIVRLIDQFGYAGLFVGIALGNVGAPIGSEIVLPVAGALVATGHLSNLWVTVVVAVVGELAGGSVGYAIGRYGGRPFVAKYGKYVRFHSDHLDQVDRFFARWGTFAIFICRFVPVVRGIVSIPAGISRMSLLPFYLWYALGSTIFCGGLILLGHALGRHLDKITPLLHEWSTGIIVVAVVLAAVAGIIAYMRSRKARTTP
jgi:membrane protein DedA with SNARE-associated domain